MALKPNSKPELFLEAEEAQREMELTVGLGEAILQRAREIIGRMKDRFRNIPDTGATGTVKRDEGMLD